MEKFSRIIVLIKEAKSVASSMLFSSLPPGITEKVRLLRLLHQIQALAVSIRADFIERLCFSQPHPGNGAALPRQPKHPSAVPDPRSAGRLQANVIAFDRRRSVSDRRHLHTYLARDRRSGIADRRHKRPSGGRSSH
jgi:hypothetical protein